MRRYTLRIYPKKMSREVSRTIEIAGDRTLDDLCHTFLYSIDFDHDHLYEFCMETLPYRGGFAYQSRSGWGEGPTTDVALDEVGLWRGRNFYLHYDFGDGWLFTVHVNKVEEVEGSVPTRVVVSKGYLSQYPDWDEEEWDEEE